MCDCHEQIEQRITDLHKKDRAEFKVECSNLGYIPGADTIHYKPFLEFKLTYRERKSSGEPFKKKTTKRINITASHCPFCGEALEQ